MDAIGRLASGISHDFSNLLTINLGYANLLLNRTDLSEKARFCVKAMNDATERAAGLAKQLLAFSRQQTSVAIVVAPNDLISEMQPLLARAPGENIAFNLNLNECDENILIDKTQLEQILLNLVINSRDAMATNGSITITTRRMTQQELPAGGIEPNAQNYLVISVQDNGHGMSEEIKSKIFEPFFTTKDSEHGTGLGLSTVFGLVEKHEGRIWVDSEIGVGTTFYIAFPVVTANASTETNLEPAQSSVV
jgi:signal transduction histidine kinase